MGCSRQGKLKAIREAAKALKKDLMKKYPEMSSVEAHQEALRIAKELAKNMDENTADNLEQDAKIGEKVLDKSKINNMKHILDLANALDEMDNIGTTDSHKRHLKKLLIHLTRGLKEPIEKVNVYLNAEAARNDGFIEFKDKPGLYLTRGSEFRTYGTDQSLIEIFAHELVHGTSHYGLTKNAIALSRQRRLLAKLRSKALEVLTPEDFMSDVNVNDEVSRELAEARLNALVKGEKGLEEFLAVGLTNEKVFKKLHKITLREKKKNVTAANILENIFFEIVDGIMKMLGKGEATMRGDTLLMKLVSDIGRLNKEAKYIRDNSIKANVDRAINNIESRWKDWVDSLEKKNQDLILKKLSTLDGKKLSLIDKLRAMHMIVASEKGTPILQGILGLFGINEEGFFQTIIKHVKHADAYGNRIQELTLAAQQIDLQREATAANIAAVINKGFKKKLSSKEKTALYTTGILGDIGPLITTMTPEKLRSVYRDSKALDETIKEAEETLEDMLSEGDYRLAINQAKGLAKLMITGESSIIQHKNAEAIALYISGNAKTDKDVVKQIDVLTSLYAIEEASISAKQATAHLLKREYDGILAMAKARETFRETKLEVDPSLKFDLIKNYHKETFDNQVSTKVAPINARTKREMAGEGYELKEKLPPLGLGYDNKVQLGLYVGNTLLQRPINSASLRYVGDREPGYSLWQDAMHKKMDTVAFEIARDERKKGLELAKQYEKDVREGKEPKIKTNVVPIVDSANNIIDFRTIEPIKHKLKYKGLVADAAMAIGRTQAHEIDIEESKRLNAVVWDELMEDMVKNVRGIGDTGRNGYRYIDISKMSNVNEVKDAISILPENIKQMMHKIRRANITVKTLNSLYKKGESVLEAPVKAGLTDHSEFQFNEKLDKFELSDEILEEVLGTDRFEEMSDNRKRQIRKVFSKDKFKVRRDMLLDIFGVRDASVANLVPNHKYTKDLKKAIKMLETAWKEIVKLFKINVIVRTLPVLLGNIESNFMYSMQYGLWPTDVAKRQIEGLQLLKTYLNEQDELHQLEAKMAISPNDKKLVRRAEELKANLNSSPIKPLIDAGLYQHIVEEVNIEDLQSNSRIVRFIDEKTEGFPQLIKDAGNWVFLSEKTSPFQFIAKMTAYSDFVARYAQYTLSMEKEQKIFREKHGRPMTLNERKLLEQNTMRRVRDAYINYAKPDSKVMQYLNDMGFVAFSKYMVRVQLAIQDLIKFKPLRFLLAIIGQEFFEATTGFDPSDIAESSIFNKDPSRWLYSPGATEIIKGALTPHALRPDIILGL